ncbi:MAG: HTH-type transcriptional regulator, global nitrogen regulator NrpRI [Methanofollis sp.]|nr:HTH-type transcriptional regulator, global nitrogen regulator NrpRI [Methanofollis sp.]
MSQIRTERRLIEILRILQDHPGPVGAKRLSELMAERGFVLTDRAVQYYLRSLDEMGFTRKIGNKGRVLTPRGTREIESALVGERIGFIISKLERLAVRTTFDPATGTGDVAYNLSYAPLDEIDRVKKAFDDVIAAECGFFNGYRIVDDDPRIPPGHAGFITICSVTMDGVMQRQGIPVEMKYGGRLAVERDGASSFLDLVAYRGSSIDPLQLFISAGLTSIQTYVAGGAGTVLANVRRVPLPAREQVFEIAAAMQASGFRFPLTAGEKVCNLAKEPYRLSIVSFSGMNLIGHAVEQGCRIKTEIGAGNIPFSRVLST